MVAREGACQTEAFSAQLLHFQQGRYLDVPHNIHKFPGITQGQSLTLLFVRRDLNISGFSPGDWAAATNSEEEATLHPSG